MYRMFITTFGWFNIVKEGKYISPMDPMGDAVGWQVTTRWSMITSTILETWAAWTRRRVGDLVLSLWLVILPSSPAFCWLDYGFLFFNGKSQGEYTSYRTYRWWFQIFFCHPYLGKIPMMTNIFQMGWNHQPDIHPMAKRWGPITIPPTFQDNDVGSALVGKASCGDVIKLQAWRFRSKMI